MVYETLPILSNVIVRGTMAIRPIVDPDPLGIIADTEGIPMPISDWRGIARLGLGYEQVVGLYGQPPKAVQHLFVPWLQRSVRHVMFTGHPRTSSVGRRFGPEPQEDGAGVEEGLPDPPGEEAVTAGAS